MISIPSTIEQREGYELYLEAIGARAGPDVSGTTWQRESRTEQHCVRPLFESKSRDQHHIAEQGEEKEGNTSFVSALISAYSKEISTGMVVTGRVVSGERHIINHCTVVLPRKVNMGSAIAGVGNIPVRQYLGV